MRERAKFCTEAAIHCSPFSTDGRYVVSGNDSRTEAKVYELPLRRSLLFIAMAGAVSTALAITARRWWRRRVSGEADLAEEPQMHLSKSALADTP
jgi:hypothetical protein